MLLVIVYLFISLIIFIISKYLNKIELNRTEFVYF